MRLYSWLLQNISLKPGCRYRLALLENLDGIFTLEITAATSRNSIFFVKPRSKLLRITRDDWFVDRCSLVKIHVFRSPSSCANGVRYSFEFAQDTIHTAACIAGVAWRRWNVVFRDDFKPDKGYTLFEPVESALLITWDIYCSDVR